MSTDDTVKAGEGGAAMLRIGGAQLARADESMIRLFVNLSARGGGGSVRWAWTGDGIADVKLVAYPSDVAGDSTPVLVWVIARDEPTPPDARPYLRRPLQYDGLSELLAQTAEALMAAARQQQPEFEDTVSGTSDARQTDFATTLSGPSLEPLNPDPTSRPAPPQPSQIAESLARLRELEQLQRLAVEQGRNAMPAPSEAPPPRPPRAPAPEADRPRPARTEPADGHDPSASYRLLRWPPPAVLRRDPAFTRLAGFLGARHLSRAQLVQASGVDAHTCLLFIATMRSLALLDVRLDSRVDGIGSKTDAASPLPVPSAAPTPLVAERPATPRAVAANVAPLGAFINRLRRRFGLR